MIDSPLPGWRSVAADAQFSDAAKCSARADRLGRKVRRRNALEYLAAVLVAGFFGFHAVESAASGDLPMAIILASFLPATAFVVWYLARKGRHAEARPEEPCREHLVRGLKAQRDLLASAWLWYVGPFLPSAIALYALVTARVADRVGWAEALNGIAGSAAVTFGIFAAVILFNVWGARKLTREIEALQQDRD